jgi:uncharacterized membrane protein YeaQ/YmgE (transglycosylase-associated protein family)
VPDLDKAITSYIGRIVAFVLTPLLLPITAVVANWLQDALGVNLNGGALAAFLVSVVVGVALAIWQWLRGRVQWERLATELVHLRETGDSAIASGTTIPGANVHLTHGTSTFVGERASDPPPPGTSRP